MRWPLLACLCLCSCEPAFAESQTPTMITIDLWLLLTFFIGILLAFFGASAAAGRMLLSQFRQHMDVRFTNTDEKLAAIEESAKAESAQWKQVERDLMDLKAHLPLYYVRREDYIRGQSVLEAKLDGLASKIENAQLRGQLGVPKHDA